MDFIGQASIVEGFRNEIKNDTFGHAYILTGETGIGKKTLAHYMAKTILCTNREGNLVPCGNCRACRGFEDNINPNFTVVKHETRNIVIKQIRDLIEDVSVRPAEGRKVYLIEDADRMTNQAQNCLLKTLEEPPPYAVIFLTTSIYESLLITIRSRAVQINLKPYTLPEMKRILEGKGININGKEHLLALSRGIPGKAIALMADKDFEENRERVMKYFFDDNTFSTIEFNQYLSKNKSAFLTCMEILESVYHDALMVLHSLDDGLINLDKKDNILKYAREHSTYYITEKISRLQQVRSSLKRNLNYQLAVDMVTLEV